MGSFIKYAVAHSGEQKHPYTVNVSLFLLNSLGIYIPGVSNSYVHQKHADCCAMLSVCNIIFILFIFFHTSFISTSVLSTAVVSGVDVVDAAETEEIVAVEHNFKDDFAKTALLLELPLLLLPLLLLPLPCVMTAADPPAVKSSAVLSLSLYPSHSSHSSSLLSPAQLSSSLITYAHSERVLQSVYDSTGSTFGSYL